MSETGSHALYAPAMNCVLCTDYGPPSFGTQATYLDHIQHHQMILKTKQNEENS